MACGGKLAYSDKARLILLGEEKQDSQSLGRGMKSLADPGMKSGAKYAFNSPP